MKYHRVGWLFTVVSILAGGAVAQSRYGLDCFPSQCTVTDQKAEERLTSAKRICSSDRSGEIAYRKGNKPTAAELRRHAENISRAHRIAARGFQIAACTEADLVVRFELDYFSTPPNVSLTVTDSDSGEAVFKETRQVEDEANDLTRVALHFHRTVVEQRLAAQKDADEAAKFDVIRHPILGALKFPKTMSQKERDQMIEAELTERAKAQKEQQCKALHSQFVSLHTPYQTSREQYDWNGQHQTSAIEKECERNWTSSICSEAAAGTGYFKDQAWPASTAAYNRHQAELLEMLRKSESQMTEISRKYYGLGCSQSADVFEFTP